MKGVVWRTIIYHHSEYKMIGETDEPLSTEIKEVTVLTPEEVEKCKKEFQEPRSISK